MLKLKKNNSGAKRLIIRIVYQNSRLQNCEMKKRYFTINKLLFRDLTSLDKVWTPMSWEHNATASWWSRYIMFIPAEEERFYLKQLTMGGGEVLPDAWRSCRPTICVAMRNTSQRIGARVKAGLRPHYRLIQEWNNQTNTQTPASDKVVQLVKNCNEFDQTQTFVAVFTKALH